MECMGNCLIWIGMVCGSVVGAVWWLEVGQDDGSGV